MDKGVWKWLTQQGVGLFTALKTQKTSQLDTADSLAKFADGDFLEITIFVFSRNIAVSAEQDLHHH